MLHEVLRAEQRIRPTIRETPLDHAPALSHLADCHAYLKLENVQHTGSFKVRGALNKLLSLTPEERARGVVAASSGNHGIATAYGLQALQMKGIVFVPENASPVKVEAIRRHGAEVRFYGLDCGDTERHARRYAEQHGLVYLSPYNDPAVIGGQGTLAVELARQMAHIDTVFVAVGGGGLIAGVAGYLKAVFPAVRVIGCSPAHSAVMISSLRAGRLLDLPSQPTLSDGTAGGVEPDAITFPLCQTLIDETVLVSEEEIAAAMRLIMETQHQLIEGAAGVAVAAFLQYRGRLRRQRVAIILCGGNISLETLKSIL